MNSTAEAEAVQDAEKKVADDKYILKRILDAIDEKITEDSVFDPLVGNVHHPCKNFLLTIDDEQHSVESMNRPPPRPPLGKDIYIYLCLAGVEVGVPAYFFWIIYIFKIDEALEFRYCQTELCPIKIQPQPELVHGTAIIQLAIPLLLLYRH
jgi:hypothetical protein